jgi:hypothetical protein
MHSFAVNEGDKANRAEEQISDQTCGAEAEHDQFCSLSQARYGHSSQFTLTDLQCYYIALFAPGSYILHAFFHPLDGVSPYRRWSITI